MATRKQSIYPYLLVAPALLLVLCVVFFPVMKAIIMSFQTYDLRRPNSITLRHLMMHYFGTLYLKRFCGLLLVLDFNLYLALFWLFC